MRKFLAANISCQAGCKYCFAKWANYERNSAWIVDQEELDSDQMLLYPCCDGDFFNQIELIEDIRRFSESYAKVYVSFSGKIWPSENHLKQVAELNDWLTRSNKGFAKFAISLSNSSMINAIEPKTMAYESRIKLAKRMSSIGIPLSLTIKPVLPFISENEYASILEDFNPYLNHVLIGGLYVNKDSNFYQEYLQNNFSCIKRRVTWLPNQPEWEYIEDPELMAKIKSSAEYLNMKVFTSDSSLVKSMVEERY